LTFWPSKAMIFVGWRISTWSPVPHIPCSFQPQEYSSFLSAT
jgi:hypothetical protein